MKDFAEQFYKSTQWQKTRNQVWKRDKGLCQKCLANGKIVAGEIVHHIKPIDAGNINNASITLNTNNLILICRECHAKEHGAKQQRYKLDEMGRVII